MAGAGGGRINDPGSHQMLPPGHGRLVLFDRLLFDGSLEFIEAVRWI